MKKIITLFMLLLIAFPGVLAYEGQIFSDKEYVSYSELSQQTAKVAVEHAEKEGTKRSSAQYRRSALRDSAKERSIQRSNARERSAQRRFSTPGSYISFNDLTEDVSKSISVQDRDRRNRADITRLRRTNQQFLKDRNPKSDVTASGKRASISFSELSEMAAEKATSSKYFDHRRTNTLEARESAIKIRREAALKARARQQAARFSSTYIY